MPLAPGQTLNNRYRIAKLLGQGGFGAIYRAWDMNLNGPCAVKENTETSPAAQQQFAREASMLFNLRHPNLPKVFDSFIVPGKGQYLVMEYIEGEDLQQMLERTRSPLPVEQVLGWMTQICDALTYLHSQTPPIIHRDVKPANIRITPQGQAILVDFGIAKVFDPHLKTSLGARAVTPGYSPPEQYGQGATDARTDIYALGATLLTLLTGQAPPDSLIVLAKNPAALPSVSTLNPSVSPRVEAVIKRAMQNHKAARFNSVAEFKTALLQPEPPIIQPTQFVGPPPLLEDQAYQPSASPRPAAPRVFTGLAIGSFLLAAVLIVGLCVFGFVFARSRFSPTSTPVIPIAGGNGFSQIIFSESVSQAGTPVNQATSFTAGTTEVWAYFDYAGMKNGQSWGRVWEHDGKSYYDSRGESWDTGASGWVAYSIFDSDSIPLRGRYTLTLYIGDHAVQQATFEVAQPAATQAPAVPSFGTIQFAHGVTDAGTPIGGGSQFELGIKEVYAIFPYIHVTPGQTWKRVWLENGAVTAESDVMQWDAGTDGVTYASLTSDAGLDPGTFTLNLYLGDQLAQSATFEVVSTTPTQVPPAKPEDIIDPDLMPAWQMLYDATDKYMFLHDTAQFALDHHIEIRMDESYSGTTLAAYSYDQNSCQPNYSPGMVIVYRQTWNQTSWEELAGDLAHELTHAMQHHDGGYRCPGCSVYKEYHSFIAQFYTWMMLGRRDLIDSYPVWDSNGSFSSDLLWTYVKDLYGDSCPEY